MITIKPSDTVKRFVELDIRTTEVFSKHGIDFCCGSHLSLEESCKQQNAALPTVLKEIQEALAEVKAVQIDCSDLPLDGLVEYIESTHHVYVRENLETIEAYLEKIHEVHGSEHPELATILGLFRECSDDMGHHLMKEERILFPMVKELVLAQKENRQPEAFGCGEVGNPIAQMHHEHDHETKRFEEIAKLSDNYTPPASACTTYQIAFAKLKEFEQDLHRHIHLENDILFPKAIALEKELLA